MWRCFSPSLGRSYSVRRGFGCRASFKGKSFGVGICCAGLSPRDGSPYSGLGKYGLLFFFFSCGAGFSLLSTRWQGEVLMGFFFRVPPLASGLRALLAKQRGWFFVRGVLPVAFEVHSRLVKKRGGR